MAKKVIGMVKLQVSAGQANLYGRLTLETVLLQQPSVQFFVNGDSSVYNCVKKIGFEDIK